MKPGKRLLPALLFSLFTAFAAPAALAQSSPFSGVYVFGDSLSDAGYFRPVLSASGLPPELVAALGRFTTNPGPVWSEIVSGHYGFTPAPSNVSGGNIYAQGGARVSQPSASTPPGHPQRPVSAQIDEFLAANGGAADPGALYAIWAGGNDFLQGIGAFQAGAIDQATLQANVLGAAQAEIAQIARLRAAGARYILVFGLPDIGAAPASQAGGPAAVAGATALSAGYNTTLFTGLAATGIRVIPVDVFSLINEVRATPAAFGIDNITGIACAPFPGVTTSGNAQFCLPSNLVAPNADATYLFADSVHPTAATHRIIADLVTSLIDGPIQYSLLAEAALGTRRSHIRMLEDGLAQGRQAEAGRLGVFAAADGGDFEVGSGFGNPGLDARTRSITVGVTLRASESLVLGAAYGRGRHDGRFGLGAGEYDLRENAWSVFGSGRWGGFHATGVLSLADLEYDGIRRHIALGSSARTASADADGSNASAHFTAGYDFALGPVSVGPTLGVTMQDVEVGGFDESGGGTAGLRVHAQTRKSEVWSAGARASMALGAWTPWVRVTADKERRDDVRHVTATPLTLVSTASSYDIPAYRPDSTWVTAAVGVNGRVGRNVALSFAYYTVESRSGIKEDGLHGMVQVRF